MAPFTRVLFWGYPIFDQPYIPPTGGFVSGAVHTWVSVERLEEVGDEFLFRTSILLGPPVERLE